MISIIFSILSGVTIVLSRSVNGMLSKKMGAYQGTFYNYFTGFMTSLILMLVLMVVGVQHINISLDKTNLMMYLGGIIGVFNILILNIIVPRISPVILTLLSFIGQLVSGMVIDAVNVGASNVFYFKDFRMFDCYCWFSDLSIK